MPYALISLLDPLSAQQRTFNANTGDSRWLELRSLKFLDLLK